MPELHYFKTSGKELKFSLMECCHSWLFSGVLQGVEMTLRVSQHQPCLGPSDEGVGIAAREKVPAASKRQSQILHASRVSAFYFFFQAALAACLGKSFPSPSSSGWPWLHILMEGVHCQTFAGCRNCPQL